MKYRVRAGFRRGFNNKGIIPDYHMETDCYSSAEMFFKAMVEKYGEERNIFFEEKDSQAEGGWYWLDRHFRPRWTTK